MRWSGAGGMGSAATAIAAAASRSARTVGSLRRMAPRPAPEALELHLRRLLAAGRRLEEGLLLEAANARDEAGRKETKPGVVVPHGLVEAHALDGDAVLRSLELALEREEVLVALELGVALDRDQQSRERPAQLVLRVLELLEGDGIVQELRRGFDAAGAGAGLRHGLEHALFLGGEALDGLHQVGNEVGPALVDVLHLRPLLVDIDLRRDELIAHADAPDDHSHQDED